MRGFLPLSGEHRVAEAFQHRDAEDFRLVERERFIRVRFIRVKIGEALGVKTAHASVLVRGGEELIVSGDRLARLVWARQKVKRRMKT